MHDVLSIRCSATNPEQLRDEIVPCSNLHELRTIHNFDILRMDVHTNRLAIGCALNSRQSDQTVY